MELNNRRKRERREKRQTSYQQAMAPAGQRAAPLAQSFNKMRIANAMRQLAVDLPDAITLQGSIKRTAQRLGQGEAQRSPSRVVSAPAKSAKRLGQGEAKRSPSRVDMRDAETPLQGKCRPRDNRKRSGGGASREFIPWKEKC